MDVDRIKSEDLAISAQNVMLKRTKQIIWFVLLSLIGNFIILSNKGDYYQAVLIAFITLLMLFAARLAAQDRYNEAAKILIYSLTFGVISLLWTSDGLYDLALLAIPGISIFAAILGMTKINVTLLIICAINILLIGVAEEYNFIDFRTSSHALNRAVAICLVLTPVILSVHLLTRDYRTLLTNLKGSLKRLKKHADNAHFLANHDILTSLPNRALVKERFEHAKSLANSQTNTKVGLLYFDIDEFKTINDSLGHNIGDSYIQFIATVCQSAVGQSDTLARLGGDEFLIVVEQFQEVDELIIIANNLLKACKEPYLHDNNTNALRSSISIGISIYPNDSEVYEDLMDKADLAMYHSKKSGRNTFSFYRESMRKQALVRAHQLEDMKNALPKQQFFMAYQPIINLTTGKSDGAEALLRWQHPEKGIINPDDFIPLAEKSGFIVELGEWALEQSVIDCLRFQTALERPYLVSVNVSAIQLSRGNFTATLQKVIEKHQVPADSLCIELTESELFSENKDFLHLLRFAKENKIKIAIDDFGTGYSNLGYLHRLNLSRLKLDYSFISKIDKNEQQQSIVASIKHLATGLKMETVAEGVETQAELKHVLDIGLNYAQGYLWSKPATFDEVVNYVKNNQTGENPPELI